MCVREVLSKVPGLGEFLKKTPYVSVVRLSGVIADQSRGQSIAFHKISKALDKAFETFNTKAVCLVINSPGGSAAQSALIGNYIRQKSEEKDLAVYAFIEDVAASGGYWLACAADEIYGQEVSIIGSVGVISASFGLDGFIEKHGVSRRVHTSGEDKAFMDPFSAEKKEDVERLKTLQKDIHESFITWVKGRRGKKLKGINKELFEGAFWTGKKAVKNGFIDGLGDIHFVMKEKFGDKVKLVDCSPEKPFLPSLFGGGAKANIGDQVIEALDRKVNWSRFGL